MHMLNSNCMQSVDDVEEAGVPVPRVGHERRTSWPCKATACTGDGRTGKAVEDCLETIVVGWLRTTRGIAANRKKSAAVVGFARGFETLRRNPRPLTAVENLKHSKHAIKCIRGQERIPPHNNLLLLGKSSPQN